MNAQTQETQISTNQDDVADLWSMSSFQLREAIQQIKQLQAKYPDLDGFYHLAEAKAQAEQVLFSRDLP